MIQAILGLGLIIASACVFNNYIDRGIDEKMARTKNRALVVNQISPLSALVFASILGLIGFLTIGIFVNNLVLSLCAIAFVFYVVIYGWAKRNTVHGTLIGSIPGAIPPLVGYCAVTNRLDTSALFLFLILVFWQMPHFYAIAIYRYKDYKAAGLPVLPVSRGMAKTKRQILVYIAGFSLACIGLFIYGDMGYVYLIGSIALGSYWLWQGVRFSESLRADIWGRKMFFTSLIVNLGISFLIAVGSFLF